MYNFSAHGLLGGAVGRGADLIFLPALRLRVGVLGVLSLRSVNLKSWVGLPLCFWQWHRGGQSTVPEIPRLGNF